HSLLVNPYDIEKTADTIYQAFSMTQAERRRRMQLLRNQIKRNDVHRWLETFMTALSSKPRDLDKN
ncbi:MAG: trehalose-6-phosphate synthase, partial [Gammaproteobacteria bacterium]|nr:trehalose-6-phosphate synthase [Gammaproteobacteria bacterium]